jgi:1,2-beta-oligoglucan phosphorylase
MTHFSIPSGEAARDVPLRLGKRPGLDADLGRDGGLRCLRFGDLVVSLFPGNGAEPSPANLWLRLRGAQQGAAQLLGPASPLRTIPAEGKLRRAGEWGGLFIGLELELDPAQPRLAWRVSVENRTQAAVAFDLVAAQDIALSDLGSVRRNEYYISHYLDLSPLAHPACGPVVAVRQNLKQGGLHPWAVFGSLGRAVSFATDAQQLFGIGHRTTGAPSLLREDLPGVRLQREHAMAAVQEEVRSLAPGARWSGGFFLSLAADHPRATSPADLSKVDEALAWAAALPAPPVASSAAEQPAPASLFTTAPLLEALPLSDAELRRHFPGPWRHQERDAEGALLSFFYGGRGHVVLREKEARTLRPHGQILRTGAALSPEESALTSTVWMAGVFHSMVTQGHVSINRLVTTHRSELGLFRSQGLRLFAELGGGLRLLGVPSAFEMQDGSCRFLYRHAGGTLEVVSAADPARGGLTLEARAIEGAQGRWLAALHLALGGDDGNAALPVPFRSEEGGAVFVPVPEGGELWSRFPGGGFTVAPGSAGPFAAVRGDEALFADGRPRGLPFLCIEGPQRGALSLELGGRLVEAQRLPAQSLALPLLAPQGEASAARAVNGLAEILPWFLDNALVHYLAPRGLEQYSGGGWGTRDVCQGPLELLLALDSPASARELLLRVFSAQNDDGDWPQWFQFFERERAVRAGDSHGDVVFWPLLGAARYVLSTGDTTLFEQRAPFHQRPGERVPIWEHIERSLALLQGRLVAGTALPAYGHGDWNDSLQPARPEMRDKLCSAWTATLHCQTLTALARAQRLAGHSASAAALSDQAAHLHDDFRRLLIDGGVIAGYGVFSGGALTELLLHPRDRQTGLRYSLLPIMHAVLEDLCTPGEAKALAKLIREQLWAPDGARLFDRPLEYRGGVERLFQRAESSSFFGREIGVMYTHAHLRYAQMQAHLGDGEGLLESLSLAHPVGLRERLGQASLRQANCYYSSSDAAFRDRYQAQEEYEKIKTGEVALDGGWRVYSSGPGIALSLVATSLLGVRREGEVLLVDPVLAPGLDGLRAEVNVLGRRLRLEYRCGPRGHGPRRLELNGQEVPFARAENPYREGGAAIALKAFEARLRGGGADLLRVELD